jgi:hypothetical protein
MVISDKQLGHIVESFGFTKKASTRRGHAVFIKGDIVIPIPRRKEISVGVSHIIARQLGLSVRQLERIHREQEEQE